MKRSPGTPLRQRLRDAVWGAKWGAALAAAITVLAAIPALIRAFVPVSEGWKRNLSFPVLVAVYFAIGLGSGAVVGFFRDFAHRWWGRRLLGLFIGIPCVVLVVATFRPEWAQGWASIAVLVISGVIWGFCMSFAFEAVSPPERRRGRSRWNRWD